MHNPKRVLLVRVLMFYLVITDTVMLLSHVEIIIIIIINIALSHVSLYKFIK